MASDSPDMDPFSPVEIHANLFTVEFPPTAALRRRPATRPVPGKPKAGRRRLQQSIQEEEQVKMPPFSPLHFQ